jgi:hypothetical protein
MPGLDVDLADVDHPLLAECCRLAPVSPAGQKRILSIARPLVYRLRVSDYRGATWMDQGHAVLWLCGARRRQEGSEEDAYAWFSALDERGELLPNDDDMIRYRAEGALRVYKLLQSELFKHADDALAGEGSERMIDLGGMLPCRLLIRGRGVREIWCALSLRSCDGSFVKEELRDVLFADLGQHLGAEICEPRYDWPIGQLNLFEAVRLFLR